MIDKPNILMISRGDDLFQGVSADTISRHEDYALAAGVHLWMVVMTADKQHQAIIGKNISIIATNSISRLFLVRDAIKTGFEIAYKHKINLIVAQDPFLCGAAGVKLKKKIGAPLQLQNHSCFFSHEAFKKERWYRPIMLWFGKKYLNSADSIRTVNLQEAEYIAKFSGISPGRLVTQPVPVSLELFLSRFDENHRQNMRTMWGLDPEKITLLWVGRKSSEKNFSLFEQGFKLLIAQHPNYQAVVVGPLNSQIPGIHCLGSLPYEHLPAVYQACDLFISTSLYEGYGRVFAEAIFSGLPVLATDTAGYKYIMPKELQFTFDANPAAMANVVNDFVLNVDGPAYAQARDEFIERFPTYNEGINAIAEEWLRLMNEEITEQEKSSS